MNTSTRPRSITAVLCCNLMVFGPLWAMPGCSVEIDFGGGADTSTDNGTLGSTTTETDPPVEAFVQMNLDPEDPEVAILTGKTTGNSVTLFGTKDASGGMTSLSSLAYFDQSTDEEPDFSMLFDSAGRPTLLADPSTGESARFDYDVANNVIIITYIGPTGQREIQTFDLTSDPAAARAVFDPAPRAAASIAVPLALTDQQTTKVIQVSVKIQTVSANAPDDPSSVIDTVADAAVHAVSFESGSYIPPASYDPFNGVYQFSVVNRVADVDFQVSQCQGQVATLSNQTIAASIILGAAVAGCAAITYGLCVFVGAKLAFLAGVGITLGADQLIKHENLTCQDLFRQAATGGTGVKSVFVQASVPRLRYQRSQTLEYNLLDPNDPITLTSSASIGFNIPIQDCGTCPGDQICDNGFCIDCTSTADCSSSTFCNVTGACVECLSADNCRTSSVGPICSKGSCTACTSSQQCIGAGLGMACTSSGCVECASDQDCVTTDTGFVCDASSQCVECTTTEQCANYGFGQDCINNLCVDCSTDSHCATGETCDLTIYECIDSPTTNDDPTTTGGFKILSFTNSDCDPSNFGNPPTACAFSDLIDFIDPSLPQIKLSGTPARPMINWPTSLGAHQLFVNRFVVLYLIDGAPSPDAIVNTPTPFAFTSVLYGDYNLANIVAGQGSTGQLTAADAVDLIPGTSYAVTITGSGGFASLVFQIN